MSGPVRVAIVADLLSERWPSMDLVADMLFEELRSDGVADRAGLTVEMLRPPLGRPGQGLARYVTRYWEYARWLKARATAYDVFHIVDHSYAHLVHVLPADRTAVTCHDIDAFLPCVEPRLATSRLPKVLTRSILSGLRKAAWVTCDSRATYDELRQYDLVPASRLTVVLNGTHAAYSPCRDEAADSAIDALLGQHEGDGVELLHVGSTIPRKRIDVLLRVVATMRKAYPQLRLIKAGGVLTADQRDLARSLGIDDAIVELPFLDFPQLAALYRHADVVLVTSAREGFGLPVIEAMACGTPVVATDLPVLREVGGGAAIYCPLGEIEMWRDGVIGLLRERADPAARTARRAKGLEQAGRFNWTSYAASMERIYRRMAQVAA